MGSPYFRKILVGEICLTWFLESSCCTFCPRKVQHTPFLPPLKGNPLEQGFKQRCVPFGVLYFTTLDFGRTFQTNNGLVSFPTFHFTPYKATTWQTKIVSMMGGGFQISFNFQPEPWGDDPI